MNRVPHQWTPQGTCSRCETRKGWAGAEGPCSIAADPDGPRLARRQYNRTSEARRKLGIAPYTAIPPHPGPGRPRVEPTDNRHAERLAYHRKHKAALKARFIAEHGLDAWRAKCREETRRARARARSEAAS